MKFEIKLYLAGAGRKVLVFEDVPSDKDSLTVKLGTDGAVKNHQFLGRVQKDDIKRLARAMTGHYDNVAEPVSIADLELLALQQDFRCRWDNYPLRHVESYEHPNGIPIKDYDGLKMWVYFTCPHCEYQWALWKLLQRSPQTTEKRVLQ